MIDVHPPHGPTHTWKDFLIHMSAICLGLLLAIGLEQAVEYAHHRRQVAEAREALRLERDANIQLYAAALTEFRHQNARLLNNLVVLRFLQQHPHTPEAQLPGILLWHANRIPFADSAWKTAQQSNVTSLMPQDEVRGYARLYGRLETASNTFDAVWPCIVQARLYALEDPDPSHLSSAQLAQEITYTQNAIVQNYVYAAAMVQLARVDHGFEPGLTPQELNTRMRVARTEHDPALAAAIARTSSRVAQQIQVPAP